VTPAGKRDVIAHLKQVFEVSERRACRSLNIDRSLVRYQSVRPTDDHILHRSGDLTPVWVPILPENARTAVTMPTLKPLAWPGIAVMAVFMSSLTAPRLSRVVSMCFPSKIIRKKRILEMTSETGHPKKIKWRLLKPSLYVFL